MRNAALVDGEHEVSLIRLIYLVVYGPKTQPSSFSLFIMGRVLEGSHTLRDMVRRRLGAKKSLSLEGSSALS